MYKTKMLCIIALLMSIAVVLVTPATAAEVIRDLPDTVYPGQEFNVNLTQSGFLFTGSVTETFPEGFEFMGVLSGGTLYGNPTNVFTMDFEGGETTLIYSLKAGTKEQIEAAEFSEGTWTMVDSELNKLNGPVTGDTMLTFVAEPTPTPPSGNGGGNGGSNGGGGGTGGDGGVTATPVASPTSTAGETPKPSPSPAAGATETPAATASPAETAAPSTSPTTTAAGKTPGFDAIFAIAGLLSVAYLVLSRRRKA